MTVIRFNCGKDYNTETATYCCWRRLSSSCAASNSAFSRASRRFSANLALYSSTSAESAAAVEVFSVSFCCGTVTSTSLLSVTLSLTFIPDMSLIAASLIGCTNTQCRITFYCSVHVAYYTNKYNSKSVQLYLSYDTKVQIQLIFGIVFEPGIWQEINTCQSLNF